MAIDPTLDFRVDVERRGTTAIATVRGDVDIASAPAVRSSVIEALADGATHIVIDLDEVDFLDSTGLGVLVGALKRARTRGGRLQVVCNQPRLRKVFEITGLDTVFDLQSTVAAAVASEPGAS
jgi:anti-sigma B factor antagonist